MTKKGDARPLESWLQPGDVRTTKDLDVKTLENWLWEAACKIRGEIDAPKYKDYILPLISLKRLSDVFGDEVETLSEKYDSRETAQSKCLVF